MSVSKEATCFTVLLLLLTAAGEAAEAVEESRRAEGAEAKDRLGEMITIPAGRFLMGSDEQGEFAAPEESPQHWVDVPAFQIGKYEVTRGQFRRFIEAGGYKDPEYWSPEGWKWKESDVVAYSGMHGSVTRVVRPNKELPREIIRKTTFHFVESVDQLFELCLLDFQPSAYTLEKIFAEEIARAKKKPARKKRATRKSARKKK